MWSSLPTSTAAAPRAAHAPAASEHNVPLAGDVQSGSSAVISPPAAGGKGAAGIKSRVPGHGSPADAEFLAGALSSSPNLRRFPCPPAVPGYEGELRQGSFGGCNVRSQGSGFPPMGPGEHQCSPGSCLPHCQRGGTFTGVKHAPLSLPPALSVSLM